MSIPNPNPKIVLGEISETIGSASFDMYISDSNGGHKAASTHCTPNVMGPIPLHSVRDWRLLQMDEAQTLGVFAEVDLLARQTSISLGIYSRDSNEDHTVYLQHPNLSTKDEPSLLRVPPVALPPQD